MRILSARRIYPEDTVVDLCQVIASGHESLLFILRANVHCRIFHGQKRARVRGGPWRLRDDVGSKDRDVEAPWGALRSALTDEDAAWFNEAETLPFAELIAEIIRNLTEEPMSDLHLDDDTRR